MVNFPQYRGSTTLYYSLLEQNKVAASAIIINEGIDTGDIICIKEFDFNFDPKLIDLIFDPLLRAVVLIYALKHLSKKYKKLYAAKYIRWRRLFYYSSSFETCSNFKGS